MCPVTQACRIPVETSEEPWKETPVRIPVHILFHETPVHAQIHETPVRRPVRHLEEGPEASFTGQLCAGKVQGGVASSHSQEGMTPEGLPPPHTGLRWGVGEVNFRGVNFREANFMEGKL